MKALLSLFGKSPFKPLQSHMEKVRECATRLSPLVSAVLGGDEETQKKLVDEICAMESEADKIKNDIRSHLPRSLFLPVDRRDLLEILAFQDAMADTCQDIAITLTLRKASLHADLKKPLEDLVREVTTTCARAADVTQELDELLETGFGGKEADRVLKMVDQIDADETIADDTAIVIARKLFELERQLEPVDVMYWFHMFRRLHELADLADSAGNRVRLLLAR